MTDHRYGHPDAEVVSLRCLLKDAEAERDRLKAEAESHRAAASVFAVDAQEQKTRAERAEAELKQLRAERCDIDAAAARVLGLANPLRERGCWKDDVENAFRDLALVVGRCAITSGPSPAVRTLRAEMERDAAVRELGQLRDRVGDLECRLAQARRALIEYCRHGAYCEMAGPIAAEDEDKYRCTCGLSDAYVAAIASTKPEGTP